MGSPPMESFGKGLAMPLAHSPENPIKNSADLNTAISVKSDGTSLIRSNVQPTAEQISVAGKNGYRFTPFKDGRPGGTFVNSNLE